MHAKIHQSHGQWRGERLKASISTINRMELNRQICFFFIRGRPNLLATKGAMVDGPEATRSQDLRRLKSAWMGMEAQSCLGGTMWDMIGKPCKPRKILKIPLNALFEVTVKEPQSKATQLRYIKIKYRSATGTYNPHV